MDYWEEAVACSLDEHGIQATDEQIKAIAADMAINHEMYGTAHGYDAIPNPLQSERDDLARKLEAEREKVHCKTCGGRGRIITTGPYHSSDSECWKCRGDGRHAPWNY